jgi:two-component system phosphate regulon sensor histidine kinase PhoR
LELRSRLLYFVLIPAMLVAAVVLGYYSIEAAQRFAEASEESVFESTLLLVNEKIDRIEQSVISTDESVFRLVDPEDRGRAARTWPELATTISPSVRSLLVLDETTAMRAMSCRCSVPERRAFLALFEDEVLRDLALPSAPEGQLRHLHHPYDGQSYLFSYRALQHAGHRYYVVLHHDAGYFLRDVFPGLFANEVGDRLYNVVDGDNERIFGPALTGAGDYVVGRSFPTTFYSWRLQVAPRSAPVLRQRRQARDYTASSLIGLSLAVLCLGVLFLIYAQVQERRLNHMRSELLANVSHELKTPLSVVRMFSELLLTERVRDDAKRKHYLETILRESERLTGLIENVLDFSAIERGKEVYQFREGELSDVVARAVDAFRARQPDGFDVSIQVEPDLPRVRFDDQSVLLVIMNLLDNAAKYGAPPILVSIQRGRRHLYVRVRDQGPGIPNEHHKRVFDRFFRVRRETSNVRGSGIGLALVKRIMDAHGGRAWVETPEGKGALVSVSFPIRATTPELSPDAPRVSQPPQPRILEEGPNDKSAT